jgi:hypothetical protein
VVVGAVSSITPSLRLPLEPVARISEIHIESCPGRRLLRMCGWSPICCGCWISRPAKGRASKLGGRGSVDLSESGKQQIWVCPMFEPFLEWFYRRDLNDSDKLPALVNLGDGPTAL